MKPCRPSTPWRAFAALTSLIAAVSLRGQTLLVNFDAPGQLAAEFSLWNDAGGVNGGNPDVEDSTTAGVNGTGGVSVFQSTDTTAVYNVRSWDFSTNGSALTLSAMILANGMVSGDKVQLGILNTNNGGLNSDAGIAFESFRLIPADNTDWTLRQQIRTANVTSELVLGTVSYVPGHWYKFIVNLTNTGPAFLGWCDLVDYGTNGLTPGASVVGFATLQTNVAPDVSGPAVYPALRSFQDAGIDAWDNLLVYTPTSPPTFTIAPANLLTTLGATPTFTALAEGPGVITYAWYTNGVLVAGATGAQYTLPPIRAGYTNVSVMAYNNNGSAASPAGTGNISVFVPQPPAVVLEPATLIGATDATLNGAVTATGGTATSVTFFFGLEDGGNVAANWAGSVALGVQTGAFAEVLSGLTTNTTYYFNVQASNQAGVVWAGDSGHFTTLATNPVPSGVAVLTHHNNLYRTGANLEETQLSVATVNSNQFGLLYRLSVDDQVYAQPLLMTNVNIPGQGVHNVLLVATVNDSVYAFDADSPVATAPLWHTSFLSPGIVPPKNTDMTGACGGGYRDFSGNIGIAGTPVIDPATGTVYLVARTREPGPTFVQRLHALDISTGLERSNSPVVITATYPGTGDGSVNGVLTFDPWRQNQRSALTLANGVVYIAWSSHCDWSPYHGWVIGYDATTLQQAGVYNDTPNGYQGGIWMSNGGLAVDETGNLYLSTGNGAVGDNGDPQNTINRGESFLKLTPQGKTLQLASWFTPYNWTDLENGDLDLGSGGVMLIPGTKLMFSGGKQGVMYLVNRDNMGGLSAGVGDMNIVQSFPVSSDNVHGGPVWWSGVNNSHGYIWPASDHLQQYEFNTGTGAFNLPAAAVSAVAAPQGQPGGILSLSANGAAAGSGVIWASHQASGDANQAVRPGVLRAFDAQNVGREIWNSTMVSSRDSVGSFAKFCPPTVANGRVYLATFSNRVNVYGILPPPSLTAVRAAGAVTLTWPQAAAAYGLQASPSLVNQAWSGVTNTPTATNGFLQVTIPEGNANSFYRLKL